VDYGKWRMTALGVLMRGSTADLWELEDVINTGAKQSS